MDEGGKKAVLRGGGAGACHEEGARRRASVLPPLLVACSPGPKGAWVNPPSASCPPLAPLPFFWSASFSREHAESSPSSPCTRGGWRWLPGSLVPVRSAPMSRTGAGMPEGTGGIGGPEAAAMEAAMLAWMAAGVLMARSMAGVRPQKGNASLGLACRRASISRPAAATTAAAAAAAAAEAAAVTAATVTSGMLAPPTAERTAAA